MNVCQNCGMGPRGIDGSVCQNCGNRNRPESFSRVWEDIRELRPAAGTVGGTVGGDCK